MREPALPHADAPSWRAGVVLMLVALAVGTPQSLSPRFEAVFAAAPAEPARPAQVMPPPVPAAPSKPVQRTVPQVAERRLASDEAEVCGLGVVRTDDEVPLAQQRIPEGVRSLALQRLELAMGASRDERLRAAEKLLRARLAVSPVSLAAAADADAACRRARDMGLEETTRFCVDDQTRSQAALLEPAMSAVDQLARMAAMSGDPQVYAFAYEACSPDGLNFHVREGSCQLISADQWARLAPNDAEPWLQLASQALARADMDATTSALARAAQAQAIGIHAGAPLALAAASLSDSMPLLEQTAVLAEFGGLGASAPPVGLDVIDTACAEPALRDAARHTACDSLAKMLVERGRLSATVTAGAQLGERLGWPAERTGAILQEQRAALNAALRFVASPQALACDSLKRQRELVLLTGRVGELEAGRELLRRESGNRRVPSGG